MFKDFAFDVYCPTNTTQADAAHYGDKVVLAGFTSNLPVIDVSTRRQTKAITLPHTVHAVSFITSTKVAAMSNGVNTPILVDIGTDAIQTLSATDFSRFANKPHTIAGDPTQGKAIGAGFTTGRLVAINETGPTATNLNPSWLSGLTANCVAVNPVTGNWLVGTSDGVVVETDFSGTSVKTFTIPKTPNEGTSRNIAIVDVIGLPTTGEVICTTSQGIMFVLDWISTPAVLQQLPCPSASTASDGFHLSNPVNKRFIGYSGQSGTANIAAFFDLTSHPLMQRDQILFNGTNTLKGLGIVNDQYMYLHINTNQRVLFWEVDGLDISNYQTRAQRPAGVDVTARMIRLQQLGSRLRSRVEDEVSLTAGINFVAANVQNEQYTELVTVTSPDEYDIREFQG